MIFEGVLTACPLENKASFTLGSMFVRRVRAPVLTTLSSWPRVFEASLRSYEGFLNLVFPNGSKERPVLGFIDFSWLADSPITIPYTELYLLSLKPLALFISGNRLICAGINGLYLEGVFLIYDKLIFL